MIKSLINYGLWTISSVTGIGSIVTLLYCATTGKWLYMAASIALAMVFCVVAFIRVEILTVNGYLD